MDTTQDALPIPHSLSHAANRSPWDPASPQTLARLLADISPRQSPTVASHIDDDASDIPSPPFESSGSDELETPSPNGLGLTELTEDGESLSPPVNGFEVEGDDLDGETPGFDETDSALRDSIRGLYALWKSTRRKGRTESDRDAFMRIIEEVVA